MASNPTCDGANVFSTTLSSEGDGMAWGWGTSYSTAIVSAVAAGVWSRNPTLTPQQLKAHLKAYADREQLYDIEDGVLGDMFSYTTQEFCLDPPHVEDPPDLGLLLPDEDDVVEVTGKAGAGVIHAGRALATTAQLDVQYLTGGVISEDTTVGDADVLVLAGDVVVDSGTTLTIGNLDGSTLMILVEPSGASLSVSGTLSLQSSVEVRSYVRGTTENYWAGIRCGMGSVYRSNGHKLTVLNAEVGLDTYTITGALRLDARYCQVGLLAHEDAALVTGTWIRDIGGASIDAVGGGFTLTGDVLIGDLERSGQTVATGLLEVESSLGQLAGAGTWSIGSSAELRSRQTTPLPGDWDGVQAQGPLTILGSLTVADAATAIETTSDLELDGVTIQNSVHGIVASGSNAVAIRNTSLLGAAGVPITITGGDVELGPALLVDGSGAAASGIVLSALTSLTAPGSVTTKNCQLHGVYLENTAMTTAWGGIVSTSNGSCGFRSEGSVVRLGAGANLSQNATGLYLGMSGAYVSGATISSNSGPGIAVEAYSSVLCQGSVINNNASGVFVGETGTAQLTNANDFMGNSPIMVANINTNSTVNATGNYWGSKNCPPKAFMFIGMVDYAGCLTVQP